MVIYSLHINLPGLENPSMLIKILFQSVAAGTISFEMLKQNVLNGHHASRMLEAQDSEGSEGQRRKVREQQKGHTAKSWLQQKPL